MYQSLHTTVIDENGIIFAETIEDAARDQVQAMLNSPIAENSHARFMPDMHAGAGCVIGTTMQITDKVCPNLVGVDIGCGVTAFFISEEVVDLEKLKVCLIARNTKDLLVNFQQIKFKLNKKI